MKQPLFYSLLTSLLLLLAACSQTQSPPQELATLARVQSYSANSADAFFSNLDGCIYTSVSVYASEGRSITLDTEKRPLTPSELETRWSSASLYISKYDECTWTWLMSAWGYTELPREFRAKGKLRAARLKTTVEVHDWVSDTTFDVEVELAWRGIGKVHSWKDHHIDKRPDFQHVSRYKSSYREANVSGRVTAQGTNLLQGLSAYGSMSQYRDDAVTDDRRAPVIEYFYAYPDTIYEGESAFLEWYDAGAEPIQLSIDQGVGDVTGEYYVSVSPTTTTTYTLTAGNKYGSDTAEVTVLVVPRPEPDGDDSPEAATLITLPFNSDELLIFPGDVDWFSFRLTKAATVTADIDAQVLDSRLDSVMGLFDADMNQLADNDDFDGLDSYLEVVLEPGTYYLAVSGYPDFGFSGDHEQRGFYYLSVTATP